MDKPIFFFDLDGPILDVSFKYYQVYADLLAEEGYTPLPKDTYWEMKRARIPAAEILAHSQAEAWTTVYRKLRKDQIETDPYLAYDRLQPQIKEVLTALGRSYRLVMMTLRSSRPHLLRELERLGLLPFFEQILSSGEELNPRWKVKYNAIQQYCTDGIPAGSWIIGDTSTDILAGTHLGLSTIAVLSGIRNREWIEKASPMHVIDDVSHLGEIIQLY